MNLFRVQDSEGRGPFRPGFSRRWAEDRKRPPTIMEDFGDSLLPIVNAAHKKGMHIGVAVFGENGLQKWFSDKEMKNLKRLGFKVVCADHCKVLLQSENQAIIGSLFPLRMLPEVEATL